MSTDNTHLPPDPGAFVTPKSKIVELKWPSNEDLVSMLEDWLEDAKAGSLRGAVIVGIYQDNTVESDFSGMANGLQTVGALEVAKQDLLESLKPEEE